MKFLKAVRAAVTVVVILFLAALAALLGVLSAVKSERKIGIVFVPGLLASGLVDKESGKPVWDPFVSNYNLMDLFDSETSAGMIGEFVTQAISEGILTDVLEGNENGIFIKIAMDEEGNPVNKNVVPADFDACQTGQRYGALRSFQRAYEGVYERYKTSGADIRIFNYDWRIDNRINAERLEKTIEERGYKEVILIGHSMGNTVIDRYLARSAENRNKTLAHISYAGPSYGSMTALTTLEDAEGMADFIYEMLDNVPIVGESLKGKVKEIFDTQFMPLIMHLPTIVQLLPSPEFLNSPYCEGDNSLIYIDGKPISTREELLSFYQSRFWAQKEDGSGLKSFVADLGEYWDGFYADTENGKVYAGSLVPTYYFAGTSVSTAIAAYFENGKYVRCSYGDGDGTVPFYSATMHSENKVYGKNGKLTEKYVVSVPVANHFECGCDFKNETKTETFSYLDDLLEITFDDVKDLFSDLVK